MFTTLPRSEGATRVFPEDLAATSLYTFWVGVRADAWPHGVHLHDTWHSYASRGVMNGVGLTTVGKPLGRRKRAATVNTGTCSTHSKVICTYSSVVSSVAGG